MESNNGIWKLYMLRLQFDAPKLSIRFSIEVYIKSSDFMSTYNIKGFRYTFVFLLKPEVDFPPHQTGLSQ